MNKLALAGILVLAAAFWWLNEGNAGTDPVQHAPSVQHSASASPSLCSSTAECPEWHFALSRGDAHDTNPNGDASGPVLTFAYHDHDDVDIAYVEGVMGAPRVSASLVSIAFALYSDDGRRVGTANAFLQDLEPGREVRFKAFGLDHGQATRYKLVELSGF